MTTFFTADLHLGHANIIKYCDRPFADVDEMNAQLVERWNEIVQPSDEVVVLGDVALGKIRETLPFASKLHGTKLLVPGNHDRCWLGHGTKARSWFDAYEEVGFRLLGSNAVMSLRPGLDVRLSHFPYVDDERHGDRFAEWRPNDEGLWLLHGHVHKSWHVVERQVNVGVDVWDYRPVSAKTIASVIDEHEGVGHE